MKKMKLTNNFTLAEMSHSNTAKAKGLNNEPNRDQIDNLKILCVELLQPLRDIYKELFIISSGFRSLEVNTAVGGVPTSQHMKGQAADITVKNPRRLLAELQSSGLDFDQAILYPSFLHISYNSGKNRRQILYAKGVSR